MTKCYHCGEEDPNPRYTLRNLYYSDGVFSRLISNVTLCDECYENVKESEHYDV